MGAFKFLQKIAAYEDFADAFCLEDPVEMFAEDKKDKEASENMDKFFKLEKEHTSSARKGGVIANLLDACKFHGWKPYAKRHPLLQKLKCNEIVPLQFSANKDIPQWWEKEFPASKNKACKAIYDAIDDAAFTDGIIEKTKWEKVRDSFLSPMDRKYLSKPKISSILAELEKAGVISHAFSVKFNERSKYKNGKFRVIISDNPVDFFRCSWTKAFTSCLKPDGDYHHTVWGALTDANLLIFFWEDPDQPDSLQNTKLRTFMHLMADYGEDGAKFTNFYNSIISGATSHQNEETIFKKFNNMKAKDWYLVIDKIHTDNHATNTHPTLFAIFDKLEGTGIKLAVPKDYTFSQNAYGLRAEVKGNNKVVEVNCPVIYVHGQGAYQDNLRPLESVNTQPPNMELLGEKLGGERGHNAQIIRSYKKTIIVLDSKEKISNLKVSRG